jgi:hypothetical protein
LVGWAFCLRPLKWCAGCLGIWRIHPVYAPRGMELQWLIWMEEVDEGGGRCGTLKDCSGCIRLQFLRGSLELSHRYQLSCSSKELQDLRCKCRIFWCGEASILSPRYLWLQNHFQLSSNELQNLRCRCGTFLCGVASILSPRYLWLQNHIIGQSWRWSPPSTDSLLSAQTSGPAMNS